MMITSSIFEQMYLRFEGAMGSHCNRETGIQMKKESMFAHNSLMTDLG